VLTTIEPVLTTIELVVSRRLAGGDFVESAVRVVVSVNSQTSAI
jgi:hypothetical protein